MTASSEATFPPGLAGLRLRLVTEVLHLMASRHKTGRNKHLTTTSRARTTKVPRSRWTFPVVARRVAGGPSWPRGPGKDHRQGDADVLSDGGLRARCQGDPLAPVKVGLIPSGTALKECKSVSLHDHTTQIKTFIQVLRQGVQEDRHRPSVCEAGPDRHGDSASAHASVVAQPGSRVLTRGPLASYVLSLTV